MITLGILLAPSSFANQSYQPKPSLILSIIQVIAQNLSKIAENWHHESWLLIRTATGSCVHKHVDKVFFMVIALWCEWECPFLCGWIFWMSELGGTNQWILLREIVYTNMVHFINQPVETLIGFVKLLGHECCLQEQHAIGKKACQALLQDVTTVRCYHNNWFCISWGNRRQT